MSEEKFDIVFKGEIVRSADIATVKNNIGKLFKIGGPKLEALFSGQAVVLKRNIDFDTATKYRVAIKKAGARVDVIPTAAAKPVPQSSSKPSGKVAPAARQTRKAQSAAGASFSIADVGADLLLASERRKMREANIDVSGISLKQAGEDLLNADEKQTQKSLSIDLSGITLAKMQGNLVRDDERKKVKVLEVNVSGLSLSAPGERLSEPPDEPPDAPDVSNIRLAPNPS